MKLERWTDREDRVAPLDPAQERAADLWRALRAEPDLDGLVLARLQSRIVLATRPTRRRALLWRLQPAFLAVLILGGAGIAAATIGAVVNHVRSVAPEPAVSAPPPSRPPARRRAAAPRVPTVTELPAPPADPIAAAPAVTTPSPPPPPDPRTEDRGPRTASARKPAALTPPRALPATAPPSDAPQVHLFSSAMRAWRERDAAEALARVQEYRGRYPGGHFAHEAAIVEVDALQALGRRDEARAFLRGLLLDGVSRGAELRLVRGELSAKAGRCDEALADLDHVLAADPGLALGARALYARASCRSRLGDQAGAEEDLRLYLVRHPDGAHAAAVRRALQR